MVLLWLFDLSASLGSQLWILFSTFLPAPKTVSYFLRSLVDTVVPGFLYVSSVIYRDVVDCAVAVFCLFGYIVKTAGFNLLPQLLCMGRDLGLQIIHFCCSSVAFVINSLRIIFSVVEGIGGFLMRSSFNVVATFLQGLFLLIELPWTAVATAVFWTVHAASAGGKFLLQCLELFLQQAVFLLLRHIMAWIVATVVAVTFWWLFTHWTSVWSLRELLRAVRVWVSTALHFGSASQTSQTHSAEDNIVNGRIATGIERSNVNSHDQQLCIICFNGPKDTVLFPCRHLSFCGNCVRDQQKCPICRKKVERKETVFL
jgi:hypothetical protein